MDTDKRIGRQTPTTAHILPYSKTKGQEAVEIYNRTGRTAREWQEILIFDIMAVDDDGLWIHPTFGYSVPRRNGKTEDIAMRIMHGLENGEKILYTAHQISTAHAVWENLLYLIDAAGMKYKSIKALGQENIRLIDEETNSPYMLDHMVNFRTRTSTGGLGEGYDLLIIDEAQEYTNDQATALKYVIAASSNPQTIMLGTPPTAISKGTEFVKLRKKILSGESRHSGWAEWSVDKMYPPDDIDAWYETNPSLGQGLTERVIEQENQGDDVDFNIQRLGYWLTYSQNSAISRAEWARLKVEETPAFKGKLFIGIKYDPDNSNVSMGVAVRTEAGKIFVESLGIESVRNGNMWIVDFLHHANAEIEKIVIDGTGRQNILKDELIDFGIKESRIVLPKVSEVIVANSMFEKAVISDKTLCHAGQKSLTTVIENCEHRALGSNGGFGYRSLKEQCSIVLLDGIMLAHWACATSKPKKKRQRVSY